MRATVSRLVAAGLALALGQAAVVEAQIKNSPVDLVQVTLSVPGKVKIGKKFQVMDEVESVGDAVATQSVTYFYLSKDDKVDDSDLVVAGRRVNPVAPGQKNGDYTPITLKADVEPGDYYLIARANATGTVDERYVDNNTKATKFKVQPADAKK
jgi:hypothetical protein